MDNGFWNRLVNSPIVFIPLSLAALGLVFVPFAVSNTEHAAEFYGSVFSSAATIIAVFAAAYLSSERVRSEKRAQLVNDVVELYYWVHQCMLRIIYDKDRMQLVIKRLKGADAKIPLKSIKNRMFPVQPNDAAQRLSNVAKLPAPLSAKIMVVLQVLANQIVFQLDTEDRTEGALLDIAQLNRVVAGFDNMTKLLAGVMAELKPFLIESGAFTLETLNELDQMLTGIAEGVEARRENIYAA